MQCRCSRPTRPDWSRLDEISSYVARGNASPERCLEYMGRLLSSTLATNADMLAVTDIIVKEQLHPTQAFSVLYEGALKQLHETGAALLQAYCGRPADSDETVVRFHALLGQSLAFRFARETIIRRAGWQTIGPEQEALIREVVVEQALSAMRALRRQHKKQPAGSQPAEK